LPVGTAVILLQVSHFMWSELPSP